MRKLTNLFCAFLLVTSFFSTFGLAFERAVLFELFTSSTCPPCGAMIAGYDAFVNQTGSQNLSSIAYHMNWPGAGNDPFYLNNPTENTARRTYYGINAVPNLKCDGILGNTATQYASFYSQRTGVYAPVEIDMGITVNSTIDVTAAVHSDASFTGTNLRLRFALVAVEYDISGTGWYYTHFENGMLDMAPDPQGILFNISPNQTVTLSTSFPIPAITTTNNLAVVAFVQTDATKEVYNSRYLRVGYEPAGVTVDLTPNNPPITIPAAGGTFTYNIVLTNSGTAVGVFDAWINATLPNGTVTDNILFRGWMQLAPGAVITRNNVGQNVPGNAPAGIYSFNGNVGIGTSGEVFDDDSFTFTKSAADNGSPRVTDWNTSGWDNTEWVEISTNTAPGQKMMTVKGPNPFNAETMINFTLVENSEAEISIFNIYGQKLGTLSSGVFASGDYDLKWSAGDYASGVYFVRIEAHSLESKAASSDIVKLLLVK